MIIVSIKFSFYLYYELILDKRNIFNYLYSEEIKYIYFIEIRAI